MRLSGLRIPSLTILLLAATLAGCDSPLAVDATLDAPIVDVAAEMVDAGAIVDMRVRNLSATAWQYNACASPRLQRREGDQWVDAPDPLILCTGDVQSLGAGQTITVGVGVPMGYEAGTYRIRFHVARGDGVWAAPTTNTFGVQ